MARPGGLKTCGSHFRANPARCLAHPPTNGASCHPPPDEIGARRLPDVAQPPVADDVSVEIKAPASVTSGGS